MRRQVQLVATALLALSGCKQNAKPSISPSVARPEPVEGSRDRPPAAAEAAEWSAALQHDAQGTRVQLTARADYHLNPDYPVNFAVDGAQRIDLLQTLQRVACADRPAEHCTASAPLPLEGAHGHVSGVLAFSVCNPEHCLIEKPHLALDL